MIKFLILLSVAVACCTAASSQSRQEITVSPIRTRAIAIISRHGDRSPEYTFPNDPHPPTNKNDWPLGQGMLLPKGRQRIAKLAELIRNRYEYLFTNIMPREVIARASGSQRVIDTGKALTSAITGLPIAVTVDERLLRDPPPECPARNIVKKSLYDEKEVEKFMETFKDLFKTVSGYAGKEVKTIEDAYEIFDTLKVERENNKTLPAWVDTKPKGSRKTVYETLKDVRAAYGCVNSISKNIMKYQLGLFLTDLQKHFANISDGSSCVRYLDYKTHDTEIAMLQRLLGVFEVDEPAPYLAAHVFELNQHATTGESFITSYYITLDHETMVPTAIASAPKTCSPGKLCPADSYFKGLQKYMLDDVTRAKVCQPASIQEDDLDDLKECFAAGKEARKGKGILNSIKGWFGRK